MESLTGTNYIDIVKRNKDIFIRELMEDFGPQYEETLSERFDKAGFVFFLNMNSFKTYLDDEYARDVIPQIIELINNEGSAGFVYEKFDIFDGKKAIVSDRENTNFYFFLGTGRLWFSIDKKHERPLGVFAFDKCIDPNSYADVVKKENISSSEFIKRRRCEFLRDIGKYPEEYSDDMICNDPNFNSICQYYENLMVEYNNILEKAKEKLQDKIKLYNRLSKVRERFLKEYYKEILEEIIDYLTPKDRKKVLSGDFEFDDIDVLSKFILEKQDINTKPFFEIMMKELEDFYLGGYYGKHIKRDLPEAFRKAREKAKENFVNKTFKIFVLESDTDVSNIILNRDLSYIDAKSFVHSEHTDEKGKRIVLFFDPFMSNSSDLDTNLRHEIRHLLTCSIYNEGEIIVHKIGFGEHHFKGGKEIGTYNIFFNELITQRNAIEKTQKAFAKGEYILSSPGSVITDNQSNTEYDQYLEVFERLYSEIPPEALHSEIEENNDNLYKYITREEIAEVEGCLRNNNKIPEHIIENIKSRKKIYHA